VASRARDSLSARYAAVCARMAAAARRAGRAPGDVRLVAVSKRVPADTVRAAAALGIRTFGESYVQECRTKRATLSDLVDVDWHFIGRVQRNKASAMIDFALVHSVADARVAEGIARAAAGRGTATSVLVQVNLSGEATKEGITPERLPSLLARLRVLERVRVVGLMTMPPPVEAEQARPFFRMLRELRDRQVGAERLVELSMGMSADFEVAIEEGATLVRIGTAIFGSRPTA
jgi:PLP dependent protein